jgi:hypothetical protein
MQPLRIFVECHPNPDMRTAHLSKPVTLEPFDKYRSEAPDRVKLLTTLLDNRIELASMHDSVNRKEIRIERNKAFTWDEAIAALAEVLGKFFNTPVELEIMERNPEWDLPRSERDEEMY